jgi:hypothetical protein
MTACTLNFVGGADSVSGGRNAQDAASTDQVTERTSGQASSVATTVSSSASSAVVGIKIPASFPFGTRLKRWLA